MKSIKFRYVCWNKHFKELEMVYLTDDILREQHHMPSWITSDNCDIRDKQLYTGIKDKNGKEIYEGDILKFHQLVLLSRKKGEIYEDTEAEIVWYERYGLSGFSLKVTGHHHLHSLDTTKGEVIGNIYENPELLEGGERHV